MRGNRAELALFALLLACGAGAADGEAERCIADHPPEEPFDVGDTLGLARPADTPGGAPFVARAPTAEDIAAICRDAGGSGCDATAFISKLAAMCIASERALAQGLRAWDVSLNYYGNHQRVGWGIMTVEYSSNDGGYSGTAMVLDAISGAELDRGFYNATP